MKFRTPIFIQAGLGKNAQSTEELCARWDLYGKTLNALTGGELSKIIIFLPLSNNSRELRNFPNLELHFTPDSSIGRLLLLLKVQRRIKTLKPGLVTLIAGDLYISPFMARILKLFSEKFVKIQVQFHGASYKNYAPGFRTRLKYFLLKISVSSSDSIRIVSSFQKYEIQSIFGLNSKEFVVSPIPISLTRVPTSRAPHQGLTFLVLGRLHAERGINKIIELIEMLTTEKFECTFHIVGDGPLRQLFDPFVNHLDSLTKVILHGRKNEFEVSNFLAKSDLLISFAQEEGYGLALREAVLSGLHVLARRNSGTEEVLSMFPDQIDLIENTTDAFKFIENFNPISISQENLTKIRKTQELFDAKNVEDLVASWIKV